MNRAVSLLAILALTVPGCLGLLAPDDAQEAEGVGASWAEAVLASGHDHADPALHAHLTTPNFRVVGHTPLISESYGTTVQGNLCGDAAETADGRRLAAVETRGDVAFSLVDVTDPANPEWLGELVLRTTYVYDLAVVPDGRHVVLVTSTHKTPDEPPAAPRLEWRSACAPGGWHAWHEVPYALAGPAEELTPRPSSVILVNVEDPANPRIVDQKPIGGYGHGVSAAHVDGRFWVAAAALGCAPGVTCAAALGNWHFYEVVSGPADARLDLLSVYAPPFEASFAPGQSPYMGHNDAWIQTHPLTGDTLAYLAAWDLGLLIVDLTDARSPRLVSRWTDHDPALPDPDRGNAHSAHPFVLGDRHFTVVGPEQAGKPETLPSGILRVLDTTDPASPREAAAWVLLRDVVWEGRLMWSPHYLSVWNATLFVSHYHAGAWALDLSGLATGEWHVLPAVGAFLPVGESPAPPERPFRWAPTLEEVHAFDDGTLVTFDSNTGLYAFRFEASNPMPAPEPWPLEPAHPGGRTGLR